MNRTRHAAAMAELMASQLRFRDALSAFLAATASVGAIGPRSAEREGANLRQILEQPLQAQIEAAAFLREMDATLAAALAVERESVGSALPPPVKKPSGGQCGLSPASVLRAERLAPIIAEIQAGGSQDAAGIARALRARGVPRPGQLPWTADAVRRLQTAIGIQQAAVAASGQRQGG